MFYALEPNSKYEVVVQSKNKWGWSQTSKPFFFKTRATGKPHVISNLMMIFIILYEKILSTIKKYLTLTIKVDQCKKIMCVLSTKSFKFIIPLQ